MGSFSGIKEAKTFGSSPWIIDGQYKLKITELLLNTSSDPMKRGKEFFIANFVVVESTNPARQVDSPICWIVGMEHGATSLGNIKAFAAVVLDCPEEDVDEDTMEQLVGPKQPAAGITVKANAFTVQTRAGNGFTKVTWDSAS